MKTEVYVTLSRAIRVTLNNFWYSVEHKNGVNGLVWRNGGKSRSMDVAIRMADHLESLGQ